jgi:hypothetical protein
MSLCARSLVALAAAVLGAVSFAAPASADVGLTPAQATQGGGVGVTFRIHNDSRTAPITTVEVRLPAESPIPEVYPYSVPDWAPNTTVRKVDNLVTAITWTAVPGKALEPGAVAELSTSLAPLPKIDKLVFTVVERHSDGTAATWTPALTLVAPAAAGSGGPVATSQEAGRTGSTPVLMLVIAALLVGLLAGVAIARKRRNPTAPHDTP